jgi:4-hydroxy-tetrahydrodipicolinate reductase
VSGLRIAVLGTGRMAGALVAASRADDSLEIEALVGPSAPEQQDGPAWFRGLDGLPFKPDVLIDFSLPAGTQAAAAWCADSGVPLLSGVTGLPDDVVAALDQASAQAPVLWSPNLSLGVNLLADLVARAAAVLGASVPVVVDDVHHQWKKDAPSGTALMLGERVTAARGRGHPGPRYTSERTGEVIGEHTVTFELPGETLKLTHSAGDRSIFARGALRAAHWLHARPPGRYSAADWLRSPE